MILVTACALFRRSAEHVERGAEVLRRGKDSPPAEGRAGSQRNPSGQRQAGQGLLEGASPGWRVVWDAVSRWRRVEMAGCLAVVDTAAGGVRW